MAKRARLGGRESEVFFRSVFVERLPVQRRLGGSLRGDFLPRGFSRLFVDEALAEIDPDHAAVLRQRPQHVVGHVAGHSERARQEECVAITGFVVTVERVVEGLVGDVRDIHDHAEAVHLPHHLLAEFGEAVVRGLVGGGVGPVVVAEMGQRHRADAQALVHPQHREIVVDLVPAFERQDGGDPPGLARSARRPRRSGRQRDLIGMRVEQPLHGVAQIERAPDASAP